MTFSMTFSMTAQPMTFSMTAKPNDPSNDGAAKLPFQQPLNQHIYVLFVEEITTML